MKNYINQTLLLSVLLTLMLTGLSLVPGNLAVGEFNLRKMDIFADVRLSQSDTSAMQSDSLLIDTLAWQGSDSSLLVLPGNADSIGPLPPKDSSWFGKIIEDYSPRQNGLNRFFEAVDSIRQGRTVRIAWYGDSFVEGDILLGDLRDTLQSVWGGQGVGFVPVTSEVAQFKRTLKHIFRGWTTYSIVKKMPEHPQYGINGYVYQPEPDAKIHYEGASYFRHTMHWSKFRFFYSASQSLSFVWQQDESAPQNDNLKATDGTVRAWEWTANYPGTSAFAVRFPQSQGLLLYGATLESGPGIYIDNFSVRGNSGGPLKLIRPDVAHQFDQYQHYDLIVLQVGLNAVTNSLNNIKWYQAELDRTYAHLKDCFPGKPR